MKAAALGAVVIVLGVAAVAVAKPGGGDPVTVEFTDARGLVAGNDVRVGGAPAGTVSSLELGDHGTAVAELELDDDAPELRSDASAAIRPVDLLGDAYVALEPGSAADPLDGAIPTERSLNAPRLDDLLRTFEEPERAGLKALLVEGGAALDGRGEDLNRAALALRPAFDAADGVMQELGSQNADLRSVVTDVERVGRQAADRNQDLGRLVGSLDATLGETAEHSGALEATIDRLAPGLAQLGDTGARLERTARAALPLAAGLRDAAPQLSVAAGRVRPFLRATTAAGKDLHPTLREAADVLDANRETFADLRSGIAAAESSSPEINGLLNVVEPAAPAISAGFFKNFPDQAAEPGTQPFDPFADERRHYWRGAAVLTCQSFGMEIKPGCLTDFLGAAQRKSAKGGANAGAPGSGPGQSPLLPDLPLPSQLPELQLPDELPLPDLPKVPKPGKSGGGSKQSPDGILDFLLGP